MGIIIGIDVGGSTTKIVGFDRNGNMITPMTVKANDPVASSYGAFGKFTADIDFHKYILRNLFLYALVGYCLSKMDTIHRLYKVNLSD